jgi:hypothetical protein
MRLAGPEAWLLVLLLPASLGLLEDLKAGLGGARAYLDNLLPMLSEGIKAVQVCFGIMGEGIVWQCLFFRDLRSLLTTHWRRTASISAPKARC